jgi:hypothetical protein
MLLKIVSIIVFGAGAYGFIHNLDGLTTRDPTAITILIVSACLNTLALFGLFYSPDKRVQKRKAQILARQKAIKAARDEQAADQLANM